MITTHDNQQYDIQRDSAKMGWEIENITHLTACFIPDEVLDALIRMIQKTQEPKHE